MTIGNIQKSILNKYTVCLCILTALVILSSSLEQTFYSRYRGEMDKKTLVTYTGGEGQNAILFNELQDIKIRYPDGEVTGFTAKDSYISNSMGARSSRVKAVITDENYIKFFPKIKIIHGKFINRADCEEGNNAVVISRSLANTLFMSADIVGSKVILSGRVYHITGVYRSRKDIISLSEDDGAEEVFIPYSSGSGLSQKPVHVFLVNGISERLKRMINTDDFGRALSKVFKKDASLYRIKKYHYRESAVGLFTSVFLFIAGIFSIVLVIRYLAGYVKRTVKIFRKKAADKYPLEILKADALQLGLRAAAVLVLLACIVFIFSVVKLKADIHPSYIPRENVFDPGFYFRRVAADIQAYKNMEHSIYNAYDVMCRNAQTINIVLAFLAVVCFIEAIWLTRILRDLSPGTIVVLKRTILTLPAGILAGWTGTALMGLSFSFPLKFIFIIFTAVFFILYTPRSIKNNAGKSYIDGH